ncbi:MAG: hypoxanthine phosphoribosyltransferase, partial [Clostridia bacterium]|nr:hypoxanthine phosphoribosyltransferase [Clostridia bacterium]
MLDRDVDHVLVSAEKLDEIITEIAAKIDADYKDTDGKLVLLGILKGSVVFMGDLMKKITLPVEIDFMKISSYGEGTTTTGRIKIHLDLHRAD